MDLDNFTWGRKSFWQFCIRGQRVWVPKNIYTTSAGKWYHKISDDWVCYWTGIYINWKKTYHEVQLKLMQEFVTCRPVLIPPHQFLFLFHSSVSSFSFSSSSLPQFFFNSFSHFLISSLCESVILRLSCLSLCSTSKHTASKNRGWKVCETKKLKPSAGGHSCVSESHVYNKVQWAKSASGGVVTC